MSARAEVRVNRGSTCSTFAPASFACITKRKLDRVALGHVRAHDQHGIGVADVHLVGRRAAAAE